jgi:hypothetical protein
LGGEPVGGTGEPPSVSRWGIWGVVVVSPPLKAPAGYVCGGVVLVSPHPKEPAGLLDNLTFGTLGALIGARCPGRLLIKPALLVGPASGAFVGGTFDCVGGNR